MHTGRACSCDSTNPLHTAPLPRYRRRSSVAPGGGGRKQQDPRPISDKEYMKTSIHSVINYLTEHHYDRPIAPRVLSSPTTKDFVHILSFLLTAIDPNFKFGGKFEEEVPVIFKSLGYKITINKGPLQSVGAAHSWPQLLAALSWLVELLNVRGRRCPALSRIAPCTTPYCPLTTTPAPAAQYSDAVNGSEPGDGFEDNDDVSKVSLQPLALPSPAPPLPPVRGSGPGVAHTSHHWHLPLADLLRLLGARVPALSRRRGRHLPARGAGACSQPRPGLTSGGHRGRV